MKQILTAISLTFISVFPVLAHPGHDNQHWMAELIHAFWLLPILAIAIFVLVALFKPRATKEG